MSNKGIFKDITGQKFGSLTAVKRTGFNQRGQSNWLFRCDCGVEKELELSRVLSGKTKKCGCLKRAKSPGRTGMYKDITGQRFGKLVAIKRVGSNKYKTSIWLFHCDCGTEKEISVSSVLKGCTKSCGCAKKIKIMAGQKFGSLTAINFVRFDKYNRPVWLWKCECGNQKELRVDGVKLGKPKSCGCSKIGNKNGQTHGEVKTRLYRIWSGMKTRCNDVNYKDYSDYGGRGIKLDENWHDFLVFKKWATENGYSDDLTIDRINTNGNYEESNCRWSTTTEQNRNRRNNVYVEANGETKLLVEWCAILNVKYSTAAERNRRSGYYFREEELQRFSNCS